MATPALHIAPPSPAPAAPSAFTDRTPPYSAEAEMAVLGGMLIDQDAVVKAVELVRPRIIVAFGTFAAQTLLGTDISIGRLRGKLHQYQGIPLVPTYHPAALLRNAGWVRAVWEDLQRARAILDRPA